MKKGFTLVELAIVLVVIGLIMGMAIKGKSLIEVAKIRSEVSKLTKIEAAMAMYVARSGGSIPPVDNATGRINSDVLTNANLITQKDLTSEMSGEMSYGLFRCAAGSENNNKYDNKGFFPSTKAVFDVRPTTDVCAALSDNATGAASGNMVANLACSIELMLDNRDQLTGNGRMWQKNTYAPNGPEDLDNGSSKYSNCEALAGRVLPYAYAVY